MLQSYLPTTFDPYSYASSQNWGPISSGDRQSRRPSIRDRGSRQSSRSQDNMIVNPDGSIINLHDGSIRYPDGRTLYPDGSQTFGHRDPLSSQMSILNSSQQRGSRIYPSAPDAGEYAPTGASMFPLQLQDFGEEYDSA